MKMLDVGNVNDNYKTFIETLQANVTRQDISKLISWLDKSSDLRTAPASTKYHLSVEGGLVKHSLHVYDRLVKIMKDEFGDTSNWSYSLESVTIVALLHDFSKINFYERSVRNVKDSTGNWVQEPYFAVRDEDKRIIYGNHAETSVYMVRRFIDLTYDEEMAILFHMGGLDTTADTITPKNIASAFRRSPLSLYLHMADLEATFVDEA